MDIGSLLPPASLGDMLAKRVRVSIDEVEYVLPVKRIRAQADWEERLDDELVTLLQAVRADTDDVAAVLRELARSPGRFIDLLVSYDDHDILPDAATIAESETELGVLCAVLEVWRAAHPFVAIGVEALATSARPLNALPRLTSSLPSSGDGPSTTSRAN